MCEDTLLDSRQIGPRREAVADDQATAGLPPERMRMHLCWGNWEGPHRYDAPLGRVLPAATVVTQGGYWTGWPPFADGPAQFVLAATIVGGATSSSGSATRSTS